MAFCSNCGGKIEEGVKFCSSCGKAVSETNEPVIQTCSNCGTKLEEGKKFCSNCGSSVGGVPVTSQTAPVAQPTMQTQQMASDEKFCFSCGSIIKKAAVLCPKCGVNQNDRNSINATDVYCTSCGKSIKKAASVCPFCGVMQGSSSGQKSKTTAIILWLFGFHRFYVGKIGTGILYWLTLGGMGIWTIIDIVLIGTDKFTDKEGNPLVKG